MAWAAVFVLSGMGLSKIRATEPDSMAARGMQRCAGDTDIPDFT